MRQLIFIFLLATMSCSDVNEENDSLNITNEIVISDDVSIYDSLLFYKGYTLIAPISSTKTYLINMEGFVVNYWQSNYNPGNAVYLLNDGKLLRTENRRNNIFTGGGVGGGIEIQSFGGEIEWQYEYDSETHCQHHDAIQLPNENILFIAWELKTKEEAIAAGRDSSLISESGLWSEMIIEVHPTGTSSGEIVWEWHVWDHLIQDFDETKNNYGDVASHPELIDINYNETTNSDILHMNGIEYIEEFNQIIASVKNYNEIWFIDHSTTLTESQSHLGGARSKGGDLLYRWGNSAAYKCGSSDDKLLFGQHNPSWIEGLGNNGGNVLLFNNGNAQERMYSSVDELIIPHDGNGNYTLTSNQNNGPTNLVWTYTQDDLYSKSISGAQRLENGNTLICEGEEGIFYEVTNEKEIVWQFNLQLEKASTFRAYRYSYDNQIFENIDLSVIDIEID